MSAFLHSSLQSGRTAPGQDWPSADRRHQGPCQSRMNFAGCTSALVPRSAVHPTRRKMEPQITQNTQKGGGALQVQDDAFDLKARLAEVEQQAEMQACGFQIIQALRDMNLIDPFGYLQFDEDDVFDE
jgi:hypothetical protein